MRMAHVAPFGVPPWSGVLTVIVDLASALAGRGHHVEVWQLHDWAHQDYRPHLAALHEAGVKTARVRVGANWWRTRATIREASRGLDVVHLHSVFSPRNTLLAAAIPTPYLVSPHGGYAPVSLSRSRARKGAYAALFERRMLRGAALVFVLTQAELEGLGAQGIAGPFALIPNGVRPPPADVDPVAFRAELGLAENRRLALFVGRLDVFHKGLDFLFQAVAEAPDWHLALIGPDHRGGAARLRQMAAGLTVGDRVSFVGTRTGPRLHEALAAADLFVLLSRWEGLPMALLEALSHGLPALVSPPVERALGVAAEKAGWVVAPQSAGELLRVLAGLNGHAWQGRRGAARRLAMRHDWGDAAERYELACARAVGRG